MGSAKKPKVEEETPHILRQAAAESSSQAVRQVLQHRLTLTVVEQGHVVEVAPDGTRTIKKELASPRLGLTQGMVLPYR